MTPDPPQRSGPRLSRTARAVLTVVGLLVLLAAVGLGTTSTTAGGAQQHPTLLKVEATLATIFLAWLVIVTVIAVVWALTMRGAGPPVLLPTKRYGWRVFLAMAIAAFLFNWWYSGLHKKKSKPPNLDITLPPPQPQQKPPGPGIIDTHAVAGGLIAALVITFVALAVASYLSRRSKGTLGPAPALDEETESPLVAAVTAALADLASEPDPRRAVIAAYARMERVLQLHGLPRQPWEAPVEYLQRVLRQLGGEAGAVDELTGLFELAKFSHHPIDESHRARAIAALEELRSSFARLDAGAPA